MAIDHQKLLLLFNWMSPTFPIGSFAYSHGMEQAIKDGSVATKETVETWIASLITEGSGWTDAVLFSRCWSDDVAGLNDMALALAGSAERYRETTELGRNFTIAAAVWTKAEQLTADIAYPVAAGRVCVAAGIGRPQALLAYLHSFCAALVSVAVRLVPLGQTQGLAVLRDLSSVIEETAKRADVASLEDLHSTTFLAEIAAMRHETLEPRIFRT